MSEATNKYPWQSKYELAKDTPLHGNFADFGVINLTQLSLEGADNLFAAGFTGLVKKKPEAKETAAK